MKISELKAGTEYALGHGDIRHQPWAFRRVEYVGRARPRYDEWNRTKVVNRGRVMIRFLDSPQVDEVARYGGRRGSARDWSHHKQGDVAEIDPISLQWTWEEFDSHVGEELRQRQAEDAFYAEVKTFFTELGIPEKRLNLGRHSLSYNRGAAINFMYGSGEMTDIEMPYRIFRKLVAGTAITEEDWEPGT